MHGGNGALRGRFHPHLSRRFAVTFCNGTVSSVSINPGVQALMISSGNREQGRAYTRLRRLWRFRTTTHLPFPSSERLPNLLKPPGIAQKRLQLLPRDITIDQSCRTSSLHPSTKLGPAADVIFTIQPALGQERNHGLYNPFDPEGINSAPLESSPGNPCLHCSPHRIETPQSPKLSEWSRPPIAPKTHWQRPEQRRSSDPPSGAALDELTSRFLGQFLASPERHSGLGCLELFQPEPIQCLGLRR